MAEINLQVLLVRLTALRTELTDLAYDLDCARRPEAADVAQNIAVRLGELCGEFSNKAEKQSGIFSKVSGRRLPVR